MNALVGCGVVYSLINFYVVNNMMDDVTTPMTPVNNTANEQSGVTTTGVRLNVPRKTRRVGSVVTKARHGRQRRSCSWASRRN